MQCFTHAASRQDIWCRCIDHATDVPSKRNLNLQQLPHSRNVKYQKAICKFVRYITFQMVIADMGLAACFSANVRAAGITVTLSSDAQSQEGKCLATAGTVGQLALLSGSRARHYMITSLIYEWYANIACYSCCSNRE